MAELKSSWNVSILQVFKRLFKDYFHRRCVFFLVVSFVCGSKGDLREEGGGSDSEQSLSAEQRVWGVWLVNQSDSAQFTGAC